MVQDSGVFTMADE